MDVIFLVYITYVLRTTVVVKPVMLVIDFSNFFTFCISISLINYSTSITYLLINVFNIFSRFCLSELYCALETNPLVLNTLVSIIFVFNKLKFTFNTL